MYRNYSYIGISFTEEDRELKKKLLECCFRVRDVYEYFIDVFSDQWWREDLKSLKILGDQLSYLVVNEIKCPEDRLQKLSILSNMLFPGTILYYKTYQMIMKRTFRMYFEDEDYTETSIYYDEQGNVENKETFDSLLDQYGNEDELYDQGHLEEGKFYCAFLNPGKKEVHIIEYKTSEEEDNGGGSNGMDTYVSYVAADTFEQNVLEREFFSEIINESIKNGFDDLTALLSEKCKDIS